MCFSSPGLTARLPIRASLFTATLIFLGALSACSGRADPPQPQDSAAPPPPPPAAVAPTVTPVANQSVQVGQTATFTESASGTAPLSYQWQKNGTAIGGATGASYTTPATVAGDDGAVFVVVVSNSAGSATTAPATLTVTTPVVVTLTITQQPADLSVASGSPATFTVAATCSAGTVSWQWQRSADGGATWTNIANANAATYTLVTSIADNAAEFRAQASCSGQTQTSTAATLTVMSAPSSGLNLTELTPGLAPPAAFNTPSGIVIDSAGVVYVVDSTSDAIRRLTTDGVVSTLAGGGPSTSGADGTGGLASFNHPRGIAIAPDGTLYVTDSLNHTVRKIAAGGVVTTLAGVAGSSGSADGSGAVARFNTPFGITFGSDGALYVADSMNFTIRRVSTAGVVTTIAGTAGTAGNTDGSGAAVRFGLPAGIAADGSGALYVSDQENNTVRKVTEAGATTTLAGNGSTTALDALGTAAGLPHPGGMVFSNGNLYFTAVSEAAIGGDLGQVRKIVLADNSVHTLAGVGTHAAAPATPQADGPADSAKFIFEHYVTGMTDQVNRASLAVAPSGAIYLTASANGSLKLIDTTGFTTSLTTAGAATPNNDGHTLPTASFGGDANFPLSFTIDPQGEILVSDKFSDVVRRVALDGSVSSVAGLVGNVGNSPADPLNGIGTAAQFGIPGGAAVAPDGSIYVPDLESNVIRKIAPDGAVTTFAGVAGAGGTSDGAPGTALFSQPLYVVRASNGVLFVSDFTGETIRRIATDGTVTTLAGTPNVQGDVDGTGANAKFSRIAALAIDSDDVLYAVDEFNKAIRKITSAGVVTTLAGGLAPDSTPLVPGFHPTRLAIAADKTVYVTNSIDHVIQSVSPAGAVSLVAGNPGQALTQTGSHPGFNMPTGIAVLGPKSLALSSTKVYVNYGSVALPSIYVLTLP